MQCATIHTVKPAVVQALLKEGNIVRTLIKDSQVCASYVELIFDLKKQIEYKNL